MVILETPVFTKQITELLDDESYAKLQYQLRLNPEIGDLIPGTGGLRKVRWKAEGRGKRGGIRVIYYWHGLDDVTYMLLAYAKNQQENLTDAQKRILKQLVSEEFS
jgi:hypothetical protein